MMLCGSGKVSRMLHGLCSLEVSFSRPGWTGVLYPPPKKTTTKHSFGFIENFFVPGEREERVIFCTANNIESIPVFCYGLNLL
jgi:hypothetical protein